MEKEDDYRNEGKQKINERGKSKWVMEDVGRYEGKKEARDEEKCIGEKLTRTEREEVGRKVTGMEEHDPALRTRGQAGVRGQVGTLVGNRPSR